MARNTKRLFISALAAALVLFAAGGGQADSTAPQTAAPQTTVPRPAVPGSRAEIQLSFAPLVKKAAPAVVNIYTRKIVKQRQFSPLFADPFFKRFFGEDFNFGVPRERVQNSLGSGVIVSSKGLIVTNHHVIEGADEITVVLADRRQFNAEIVGSDERTDLAVLRVDAKGARLPFLKFRDSDDLEVGDLVLAIGNPFGVGQTVTSGIVSAVARTQVGINDLNFFIQTDAAINPGNSGGALVTLDGKLVGINSAIYSRSGGSIGIGFAIPANMVRIVIANLVEGGKVVRPWLGATGQAVTADIATAKGLARPAGDVVTAVGAREVNDQESLNFRIATRPIGETTPVAFLRRGHARTARLAIEAPPEKPPRNTAELTGDQPLAGAVVANLSPALAEELRVDPMKTGVMVVQVRRGSPAQRFRVHPGDILRAVNDDKLTSVARAKAVLARPASHWAITIERGNRRFSMVINR